MPPKDPTVYNGTGSVKSISSYPIRKTFVTYSHTSRSAMVSDFNVMYVLLLRNGNVFIATCVNVLPNISFRCNCTVWKRCKTMGFPFVH